MKKHPRLVFGISEDGLGLRLAMLETDSRQFRLARLDLVELDKPLYRNQEELTSFDDQSWESDAPEGELKLNGYDAGELDSIRTQPWERLFGAVNLHRGVIAINVNEENLVRGAEVPQGKVEERAFVRANLDALALKRGEWQSSRFQIGGTSQFILHKGVNRLLEILELYAWRRHKRFYYQLADANDIALADYFRTNNLQGAERVLLVCLGREYRKALLFDKGQLVDIYPLNITQDLPEPELIYSRVSFALDSALQTEPEKYVICGDLASLEILERFNRGDADTASLLTYPGLVTAGLDANVYTPLYLAQFALPIALAHKAITTGDTRCTPSNFLPGNLIEAQKPFKIAWHGFLIMGLIFLVSLLGTVSYLSLRERYDRAFQRKRDLDHELAVLKIETAEIALMKEQMSSFNKNLDAVRIILKGKNPWSAVLENLNQTFQSRPLSWLTNFKKEGSRLHLTGQTTNRSNIIAFADALPNSRIQKVTTGLIHNSTVWTFEITADFPPVDWVGQIEADMAEILEQNRLSEADAEALEAERAAGEEAVAQAEAEVQSAREAALAESEAAQEPQPPAVAPKVILGPITSAYMPRLTSSQIRIGGDAATDYIGFVKTLNRSDLAAIKGSAAAYLKNYGSNRLAPLVRWHLANKLYRAGDYRAAIAALDPLVHEVNEIYPYALLLSARIDYARGHQRFIVAYRDILKNYPTHPVRELAVRDLILLDLGDRK